MNLSNMAASLAARDAGISSSAAHAEADAPGWQDQAYAAMERFARHAHYPWTVEQFREFGMFGVEQPAELRAYGSLAKRAIKTGLIHRVGYAPAASSHGSPKALYFRS